MSPASIPIVRPPFAAERPRPVEKRHSRAVGTHAASAIWPISSPGRALHRSPPRRQASATPWAKAVGRSASVASVGGRLKADPIRGPSTSSVMTHWCIARRWNCISSSAAPRSSGHGKREPGHQYGPTTRATKNGPEGISGLGRCSLAHVSPERERCEWDSGRHEASVAPSRLARPTHWPLPECVCGEGGARLNYIASAEDTLGRETWTGGHHADDLVAEAEPVGIDHPIEDGVISRVDRFRSSASSSGSTLPAPVASVSLRYRCCPRLRCRSVIGVRGQRCHGRYHRCSRRGSGRARPSGSRELVPGQLSPIDVTDERAREALIDDVVAPTVA